MLNFRDGLRLEHGIRIDLIPAVNILFLVGLLFAVSSFYTRPAPLQARLPVAVTSDIVHDKAVITITGENILYLNGNVVTLKELRDFLMRPDNRERAVFLKVDKRASVGRISDVLDLGRTLGIKRIDVATD